MQTKSTRAAETAALLQTFGLELSAGDLVVMTDFALAESAYIHHSTVPVAVAAMAVVSPTFARGRFPKLRLVDVVAKVLAMDGREIHALATVCGANIDSLPEGSGRAPAFAAHLVDVIARYELGGFFLRDPSQSAVSSCAIQAKVSTASMSGRVGSITVPMRWSPPRWPNGGDPTRHCHPRAR